MVAFMFDYIIGFIVFGSIVFFVSQLGRDLKEQMDEIRDHKK